jgi:hypothetical protein
MRRKTRITEKIFVGDGLGQVLLARFESEDGVSKGSAAGRRHGGLHGGRAREGLCRARSPNTLTTDLARQQHPRVIARMPFSFVRHAPSGASDSESI